MNIKNYQISTTTSTLQKGFTLLEILVVLSIVAVIIGFTFPNFLGARERARDQKRKSEAQELKKALQLYYTDYKGYPSSATGKIYGCGTLGTSLCPVCTSAEFAAGNANGCRTTYMRALPKINSVNSFTYYQCTGGDDYRLLFSLENLGDPDITATQTQCPAACGATYTTAHYVLCAD